jgi:two-component system LytT family response regulator
MTAKKVLRALIVDDEPPARHLLRSMLHDHDSVNVVADAETGADAVSILRADGIDLVFLDVQMPGMSGFDVIDAIGAASMPAIVFVTAYDRYAVRAFEVHAVDYILKPYDRQRLEAAVARAVAQAQEPAGDAAARLISLLEQVRAQREYPERLAVRTERGAQLIDLSEVGWIEADDKTLRIHLGADVLATRGSMRSLEAQLDPARFVRVHRSIIVNTAHVRELQPWFQGDYVLILRDGSKITTGRTYRDNVTSIIKRAASP